jgi:diaminohydroxyphosphoribosylaminopyrimidine deaminase/5-amino-6-(5-phosphoribosylamino)uracil reductase
LSEIDEQYIRRAIRVAMNGRGVVEPNPMVGCVIVKDGRVIGEGHHQFWGGPHAEPTALAACSESPEGATAYVTLEPCCHANKKTPPCAPRVIQAGISRVVVGCIDPNPDVNGKGLTMLREAGIEVVAPLLEGEAEQLLAPFIGRTEFHRPYVTMKWAETADRKVAGPGGRRMQISGPEASAWVQKLRSRSDAILVGVNTALADDPLLTARVDPSRLAVRIVLDSNLRLPPESQLAKTANDMPVDLYFTRTGFIAAGPEKIKRLMSAGVQLREAAEDDRGRIAIAPFIQSDRLADIAHLLVEPGPMLARSFFDAGAADRLWVIRSPRRVEESTAPAAAEIPPRFVKTAEVTLGDDTLTEYLDQESDLFFAAVASADVVV